MKKALDVNWVARELGAAEKILFMPGNGGIVLKKEDNGWSVQLGSRGGGTGGGTDPGA